MPGFFLFQLCFCLGAHILVKPGAGCFYPFAGERKEPGHAEFHQEHPLADGLLP